MQTLVVYFLSIFKLITDFCTKGDNAAGVLLLLSLLSLVLMAPSQGKRNDRFVRFLYKRFPLFSSYGQAFFAVKFGSWVFMVALLFFDWGSPPKFWFFALTFFVTTLRFIVLVTEI